MPRHWTGTLANGCTGCGQDFASVSAFDRHRVGAYMYTHARAHARGLELDPPRDDGRRCLDADEMRAAGMERDSRGRWSIVADVERARRAFAEAA